ncbi:MAG: ATP-binding protein [Flavobacteriales bacterium]|nr:ATP-binding protein [Flavobacteriales bacterium]MCB9191139.1 ATP-binding protein [Flavobacteriales bacterium]MCB9203485.1 ATP-binding protein [Flavobacteriales bacterium]
MEKRPQIFACVGPESTGKTTLSEQLASRMNGELVPEFARDYLEARNGKYSESDLPTIAKGQLELEKKAISNGLPLIFCDTDIVVVKVWQEFKYGKNNEEIDSLLSLQQPRKYLLTYPDLPWEEDSLRENPNELVELFKLYESTLKAIGADYRIVRGVNEERPQNAIEAISSFTQSNI